MYLLRVISVISAFLPVQSPCFFDVRVRIPPYNGGGGALIDAVLYSQVIDLLVYYFYGSAQFNSLLRELCD